MTAATELELVRSKGDRRLYELADTGTLRLEGIFSRSAIAEANSERWTLRRRLWTSGIDASDTTGATVGAFTAKRSILFVQALPALGAGLLPPSPDLPDAASAPIKNTVRIMPSRVRDLPVTTASGRRALRAARRDLRA